MLSKVEAGKRRGEGFGHEKLLHDIEAINKAIYPDKSRSRSSIAAVGNRSKSVGKTNLPDPKAKPRLANADSLQKDKKSFWSWKPLKALSHIRNRRFNCCFSLQVHSIEGLPRGFDDVNLCVHWKRRDGGLVTRPVRVFHGIAEFDEELTHTCSVYGSRSGPHHSAKYEAKHFLLYVSIFDAPEVDLGKHRVDLTRLLPLTLEELEEEKSSAKWTTSYKLSGKAKGALMNVSFGYLVIGDNAIKPSLNTSVPEVLKRQNSISSMVKPMTKFNQVDGRSSVRRDGRSLPGNSNQRSRALSRSVEEIKVLREVLPVSRSELSSSVNLLYQKLDEGNLVAPVDYKSELDVLTDHVDPSNTNSDSLPDSCRENVSLDNEFSIIDHGIELPLKEQMKSDDGTVKAAEISAIKTLDAVEIDRDCGVALEEETKLAPHGEECTNDRTVRAAEISADETLDFVEIDHGFGVSLEEKTKLPPQDVKFSADGDKLVAPECSLEEADVCSKESLLKELESALGNMSKLEIAGSVSPEHQENYSEDKLNFKTNRSRKSHSLDDVTESVASEFLNMLGIDHSPFGMSSESEPESPRERLLRQFEEDTLACGTSFFDFGSNHADQVELSYDGPIGSGRGNFLEDFELPSVVQASGDEHQFATHSAKNKVRAKMLEDLETEALMHEWGLNEKAFQCSPPSISGGFGSPIDFPPEEPLELPPLGEGLGPFAQTPSGGFLRSMNPSLFRNAKSGGDLIMQVSTPVVVPAEMGSGIMEILQRLASAGIEKLSMQANKLMPLEDITGQTMQQIAWEAAPKLEAPERQALMQHESELGHYPSDGQKRAKGKSSSVPRSKKFSSSSGGKEIDSEYVSLEELAPLAMDKIEALSIEGLRIQSGMSDEDAPSNISSLSIGEISTLAGKNGSLRGSIGLEGAAGLQLLDIKDSGDEVDGLMGLSLTLDEWMRLDSGEIDDDDQISERTSKILAAHHANRSNLIHGGLKGEKKKGKSSSRKCGLLGNNFTVALMVQLRDPLRNYEPVGTPMLALIQVERVFVPPKPKIYSTVSEVRNSNEDDDESETQVKEERDEVTSEEKAVEEEKIAQFKITEVHVAGLKTEPSKKKLWGTTTQQQSGSRWLLANGMGKNNKHPFMKSKAPAKSTAAATAKVQPGDTLWSISARVHGTGAKWKELASLNPHIRNPNVIFPNETIRLN